MSDSVTRLSRDTASGQGPSRPADVGLDETTTALPITSPPADGSSHSTDRPASPLLDDQKTVISKRPPVPEPLLSRAATPAEMGRLLVGERLGHFQLEEFVGGGGMGAVFRATDTMLGRTVAVKVLSREQTDEETLRRFKNEAQNAARLDHERIARVYYVGEDKGWHYIVFEYIDGVNVRDLVDEHGPLPVDEAVYYTLQVAEALRHAFRRDVVHRDIKPSNILVMPDGRAKLVDMGLARLHQVESPQNDLTASGVTLGTFDYISPEQARDPRNADVRSDIYSLGCTLYFMLTGRPPFPDGTVLQKLLSHSTDAPPDPRLYRSDIPDDICRVLNKTLLKNPLQRYQNPDELIAELLRVADRLGLERSTSHGAVWVARPEARPTWYEQHLPWMAPVVALLCAVMLLEWFSSRPLETYQRPRPALLSAINTPAERRPPRPQIPVSRPERPEKTADGVSVPTRSDAGQASTPMVVGSDNTDDQTPASRATATSQPASPRSAADGSSARSEKGGNASSAATSQRSTEPPAPPDAETDNPPMPPTVTRMLLVGPDSLSHEAHAKVVKSLAAALDEAAMLPGVEVIELHFDGEKVEQPMTLALDRSVVIRAGKERKPVIVFRPTGEALAANRRMLTIEGGEVAFEDVQIRLELPTEYAGDGWSLLALTGVESLQLTRCALTIKNAGPAGALLQNRVSFIGFLPPPAPAGIEEDDEPRPETIPYLALRSSLVRGEATFIASDAGTPFRLTWDQGLLATTDRLIDIGGVAEDRLWNRLVRLELDHVTAITRSGLCLLRSREAQKPFALEVDARNCIFVTDSSAPLIEQRTFQMIDEVKKEPPKFEGRGNIYSGPIEYWRIVSQRTTAPLEPTVNINFTEGDDFGFEEPVLQNGVLWKGLPSASRPMHAHTKADYLLSSNPANPALRRGEETAGFDSSVLPDFHAESPPAAPMAPSSNPEAGESEGTGTSSPTMSEKMKIMMATPPMSSTPKPPPAKPMPEAETPTDDDLAE